jgi:cysteine desulfurase/selenocysteine lyase
MTTNNDIPYPDLPNGIDWNGALNAAAASLPDPAALARLANEFFRENLSAITPGGPELAPASSAVRTISPSERFAGSEISEIELQSLPAAPADFPGSSKSPRIVFPGIPGGVSADDISADSAFSFLEEARSLFHIQPAPLSVPPAQTIAVPTETEIKSFQAAIPGNPKTPIKEQVKDVSDPQVPGGVLHDVNAGHPRNFGFLDEAHPIIHGRTSDEIKSVSPLLASVSLPSPSTDLFDVNTIRRDFPILQEKVNGHPLVWLDNAATTQKPQAVIDRLAYFYAHENSNVHRGAHTLAARATDAYEDAREKVRRFLNASSAKEIVFVRGTTEAINLVAQSWGRQNVHNGDEIIVSWLEHHANIVPWQQLAAEKGAKLRMIPVNDRGELLLDEYEKLFNSHTRFVSVTQVSNALGTVAPVSELVQIAHRHGVRVLVDGAQAVSHLRVDVQAIDADFYVFSGHKIYGPTGIGVVYGKAGVLDTTQPWQGGGNMIADVTFEKTLYQQAPARFEAGTGNIADAVGLGAAIDYVERIGMENISRYEHNLLVYGTEALQRIPGLHIVGTAKEKASVLSFVMDGFRTEDVGAALSREGIAVRSGHHCAQPILRRFGLEATVRPSLAFYNTCQEIDALVAAIWNLKTGRSPGIV